MNYFTSQPTQFVEPKKPGLRERMKNKQLAKQQAKLLDSKSNFTYKDMWSKFSKPGMLQQRQMVKMSGKYGLPVYTEKKDLLAKLSELPIPKTKIAVAAASALGTIAVARAVL
jgi:hypothetical protein